MRKPDPGRSSWIETRRRAMAARGLIAVAALLIGLAPGGSGFAEAAANPGKLVKVVVVSRHGVRAPLNKAEELALLADKDWPDLVKDWQGSEPGRLTPAPPSG